MGATSSWSDPGHVDEYRARSDRSAPRAAGEEMVLELLPGSVTSVLDLGCGDGRLLHLIGQARPGVVRAVGTDVSEPMLERARARLGGDAELVERDLRDGVDGLGTFDVVVSGFAIHHVEHHQQRELYRQVAEVLTPGGRFVHLEVVRSATDELHREFLDRIGRSADDPEDRLATVGAHLTWMRAAGLRQVDCFWRWRGFVVVAGTKG